MMTYGKSPFLECSSKGDKRFSAFYAKVKGRSIEVQYQEAKVFEGGVTGMHWRKAKGRRAVNAKECAALYIRLWEQYIKEHPELLKVLRNASGLSDMFARQGSVNQAAVLWDIRNAVVWKEVTSIEAVKFLQEAGYSRDEWELKISMARDRVGETIIDEYVAVKTEINLEHIFALDWFVSTVRCKRPDVVLAEDSPTIGARNSDGGVCVCVCA